MVTTTSLTEKAYASFAPTPRSALGVSASTIAMSGIQKSFPGVHALKNVDLEVRPGEIRGLAGENGAGKSTLIKIMSGAYRADGGQVSVGGIPVDQPTPQAMIDLGIAVIYQELSQAPHLTVAENVLMGRLPRNRIGTINWREARRRTAALMTSLGFNVDPKAIVGDISVAQRQMVEITKAISRNARLIVLDEPSAVLGEGELQVLFETIRKLSRENGVSFLYVSHRLKEFFDLCHSVTVLRDGAVVDTLPIDEVTSNDLIRIMVGRSIQELRTEHGRGQGDILLKVRSLGNPGKIDDISFDLHRGEILGICGLVSKVFAEHQVL